MRASGRRRVVTPASSGKDTSPASSGADTAPASSGRDATSASSGEESAGASPPQRRQGPIDPTTPDPPGPLDPLDAEYASGVPERASGGLTWSVGVIVVALLVMAALVLPVPYVLRLPGPTSNTLGSVDGIELIRIEGAPTYPTSGHLDLTTIRVRGGPTREINLAEALRGWIDPQVAVLPSEVYYPAGRTTDEAREEDALRMVESQTSAKAAALRALDIQVPTTVTVGRVAADAPAQELLEPGDVVLAVGDTRVGSSRQLRAAIQARPGGEPVPLTVLRDGEELTHSVPTQVGEDGRTVVGIFPTDSYDLPFTIDIGIDRVGGPSAGLLLALGIVDKLTPGALTGGAYIAGTGTIDGDGTVGRIGGIEQKVVAAHDVGATVFLVPADNCGEALGAAPEGLRLVRVDILDTALDALAAIRDGTGTVASCEP